MQIMPALPEFRFYYFTNRYLETISFYKEFFEMVKSWDNGPLQSGTVFRSPNGTGLIEIEEGEQAPVLGGGLYMEVDDVDVWYEKLQKKNVQIIQPLSRKSYGHYSVKFEDPNGLSIGLFRNVTEQWPLL